MEGSGGGGGGGGGGLIGEGVLISGRWLISNL